MNAHRLKAYIYLLIVAVIWGIAGPVIKLVEAKLPWDLFLSYRFLLAGIVVIPFIKRNHLRQLFKSLGVFLRILIYGLFTTTLGLSLLFAGTEKTSVVSMSLISLFGPIMTIIAGYFFLKDKITWLEKIGIAVTFIGSFLIVIEPVIKLNGVQGEITGNMLIFGSLILGTIAALILKGLLREGISPVFLANFSFIAGVLTIIPISLYIRSFSQNLSIISSISLPYHAGVWYMALISGILAYSLANIAQKSIEVSEQAVFGYLYPIISAILAVLILKEPLTPLSYFGGGMTLVGIFIAEVKRRSQRK